nr:imelysin family protein [uncultured Flavobacterium sp.]
MKKIVALLSIVLFTAACSSSDSNGNSNTANYDKTAVLTNWADNIIIPTYTAYDNANATLQTSVSTFTATPNADNLVAVQTAWLNAYKVFQHAAIFDIGKATNLSLVLSANTFPTDVTGIRNNVTSGTYTLGRPAEFARQGFPALDYLLYGLGTTNDQVLTYYTTNTQAAAYKQYLTAVTADLKRVSGLILTDWNGSYRDTFIANDNAVTGSLNHSTNNLVKNMEKDVRNPKLGIPAGLFSAGTLYPDKVEAYYRNNVSKTLLNEAVTASKNFFNGTYYDGTGSGASLKGYLDAVGAKSGGQNLSDIINAQFNTVLTTNNTLNESFSTQVTTDNTKMIAAHTALQKLVVYLKLDMFSALSLTIDYVDGDGD